MRYGGLQEIIQRQKGSASFSTRRCGGQDDSGCELSYSMVKAHASLSFFFLSRDYQTADAIVIL